MNTCQHCKWWTPPASNPWHGNFEEQLEGYGCCELTRVNDGKPKHPTSLSITADNDNWRGVLNTAPDFGCVQFERQ